VLLQTLAVLTATLALTDAAVSSDTVELHRAAASVIAGNPLEYFAAVLEVEGLTDSCESSDILCVDRVIVREVLGQRTTEAKAVKKGEHVLMLAGFIQERADIRKGVRIVMVGVPVWLHGEFWSYSPLALKVNPTPEDIAEVKRAVSDSKRPGV
jgi:hypothetical protein